VQWFLRKIFSPLWLILNSGYHDFNTLYSTVSQKVFMYIWAFLVQWFLKKISDDPTQLLHFCFYLPFKEVMALYLNKAKKKYVCVNCPRLTKFFHPGPKTFYWKIYKILEILSSSGTKWYNNINNRWKMCLKLSKIQKYHYQ
jgi:hypothetical protein